MNRSELKARAREQLGNRIFGNTWLIAVLICFIYGALVGLSGSATFLMASLILYGPLTYGVSIVFLKKARNSTAEIEIKDLFNGFTDDFSGTFLLGLLTEVFIFLWSLLFVIPGIIKSYAYSMAYFIKKDHPEYDWKQCLDESIKMTSGHKWELFILDLSFLGWYILGALCLGVGILWVVPYHMAARANAYDALNANVVF